MSHKQPPSYKFAQREAKGPGRKTSMAEHRDENDPKSAQMKQRRRGSNRHHPEPWKAGKR